MKKLTTRQIPRLVKKNNERFEKATDAEKRVMIAKDVIDRLKAEQYIASPGTWSEVNDALDECYATRTEDQREEGQVQFDLVAGAQCRCCGVGAIFLSMVAMGGDCSINQFDAVHDGLGDAVQHPEEYGNEATHRLKELFGEEQIAAIEKAFEEGGGYYDSNGEACDFACGLDPKERLRLIMQNIVDNKGEFKP